MSNLLQHESSPYLLQHAENPVNWYPWCDEAFSKAKSEDKPVFLSIGYSTCHWCHVMAHESFEDDEIAEILNRDFVSIKVDKEERPDIDSIYMSVCQAFTGSGGWPTSIFMTADQRPFFAGTYFPKTARGGMPGLKEILTVIREHWDTDRETLLEQADAIVSHLSQKRTATVVVDSSLTESAVTQFKRAFDHVYGGFGRAPKFPTPHNLMFLTAYYERTKDTECLDMVEQTLQQMYRGGIFDHFGYGFSRYSTDNRFLVPHFEKMLYDNALLILAYCRAYTATGNDLYRDVAVKTAAYVLREMTSPEGGFYSAQDADVEGEEGKYYLFTPEEVVAVLGEENARSVCMRYDITERGNFQGKSIPNLLVSELSDNSLDDFHSRLCDYRRERFPLHLDDKVLTAWNGLMIAAMAELYRVTGNPAYLTAAEKADHYIMDNLWDNGTLFVSYRDGKRGVPGFLDDYAAYIFAQLALYGATLEEQYLKKATDYCSKVISQFGDKNGGFYMYGSDSETLIMRPKETYDGAIPSGNSLMAWNLVRLSQLTPEQSFEQEADRLLGFISSDAGRYPIGHAMFLLALLERDIPSAKVVIAADENVLSQHIPLSVPGNTLLVLREPSDEYPLVNGRTTYYVCRNRSCLPPANDLDALFVERV